MRRAILLATLVLLPQTVMQAQQKAAVEPARVAGGVMTGRRIEVRRNDWINPGRALFTLTLTGAGISDGRLQFTGVLQRAGSARSEKFTAPLVSTTARSANPWPNASAPTARAKKKDMTAEEVSEQTQSLYSGADTGSGCELLFLRLPYPTPRSSLQVGVALAHQDNDLGERINHSVCQIVRDLREGKSTNEALARLNELLK
ncbi:MAG: hypothetical protein IPM66_13570 [Acidobacteriota bacterium]|nr:MAG: hypothetical protein IPM66_13570 [Acidobacteriota bacterium]